MQSENHGDSEMLRLGKVSRQDSKYNAMLFHITEKSLNVASL